MPGRLPAAEQKLVETELGYTDKGMIMSESFGLWAIETNSPRTREVLSFSKAHAGIHVVDDISKFRELKLRLLNGSHNLSCAVGYLSGFETVKEAMADASFNEWIEGLILEEIAGAIVGTAGIEPEDARAFGSSVLSRYRNPYIHFEWLSICVEDTSKLRIRAVPIVLQDHRKHGKVGERIAMGFAAYILFMKGGDYRIVDEQAGLMREKWERYPVGPELVKSVLEDERLWGVDLYALNGFGEKVSECIESLLLSDVKK